MTLPPFALPVPQPGRWRAGNTGIEGVWRFDSGRPGREVLVTALVHGNELSGAQVVIELLEAGIRPRRGVLTLALCHLTAFDLFDLHDPDASRFVEQDLNRVWGPALREARGALSIEQRRALELLPLAERADWLLDLHSMHEPGPPLLLTGPHRRNIELARELGAPAHVVVDAGHTDGVRLRDHGRFGDPHDQASRSLLLEAGWHGDPASVTAARDLTARFLCASGACGDDALPAGWRLPAKAQSVLEVTHAIVARSDDTRFARPWQCAERVPAAGTLLGWREDEPFVTPFDDCTLVMPSLRQLRPGVTVMRLARTR